MSKLSKVIGFVSSTAGFLTLATSAFAQSATAGAAKGGTNGALPGAGTTEITYAIFIGGVVLFVFGMLKLAASYRD